MALPKKMDRSLIRGMKYSPNTGLFYQGGSLINTRKNCKYRRIRINGTEYQRSRLAFLFMGINIEQNQFVDHINGDTRDNRWSNLRIVSVRQNGQNRLEHRKGKLPGTQKYGYNGRYKARLNIDGKEVHLGVFDTEKLAHEAYVKSSMEV